MRETRGKMQLDSIFFGNTFLDREFELSGTREHDLKLLLEEVSDRTSYQFVDPDDLVFISIVKVCTVDRGDYKGEKGFIVLRFMPNEANINLFLPQNLSQLHFEQKRGNYGLLPFRYLKERYGMTDSQIREVRDIGFLFSYDNGEGEDIYIPSHYFLPSLCRTVCGISSLDAGIDPIRDIYVAHLLQCQDPFLMVSRRGSTVCRAFGCFSGNFTQARQTVAFGFKRELENTFRVAVRQWRFTHPETTIDFVFSGEQRMVGGTRVGCGARLTLSDTGDSSYILQNCLYLNGGTVLCDGLVKKRHTGELKVEAMVGEYLGKVYPKLQDHFEELEQAASIPVGNFREALEQEVTSLKLDKVIGKKRFADYQKAYIAKSGNGETSRQQVLLEMLKIPGYLQDSCDSYIRERVSVFPSGIFQ